MDKSEKKCMSLGKTVTPHPSLRQMMGAPHKTGTPLPNFLTLVGPFRSYFHNYILIELPP